MSDVIDALGIMLAAAVKLQIYQAFIVWVYFKVGFYIIRTIFLAVK